MIYIHKYDPPGPIKSSSPLDNILGFGSGAACMCCVCVPAEFKLLCCRKLKYFLESLANFHQILATACFSGCAGPETNTVEALSDVDNHTHDLALAFILQGLADCGELCVKPELVNVDQLLVLETV